VFRESKVDAIIWLPLHSHASPVWVLFAMKSSVERAVYGRPGSGLAQAIMLFKFKETKSMVFKPCRGR